MRGNATQIRVHYKGDSDDFIVFAESGQAVQDWKKDRSIPLAQVVDSFKVFVTHNHGNQGTLDTAAKGTLEAEFGSSKEEDVIIQILEKGNIIESENSGRDGVKNVSSGGTVAH